MLTKTQQGGKDVSFTKNPQRTQAWILAGTQVLVQTARDLFHEKGSLLDENLIK